MIGVDAALPGGVFTGLFLSIPLLLDPSKFSTDLVLPRNFLKNAPPLPDDTLNFDGDVGGSVSGDILASGAVAALP